MEPEKTVDLVALVKKTMPDTATLYELADFFKIIGDGTRIQLLCALELAELCVSDLAEILHMTNSAVSHQLKVLRMAKLVRFRKEGKNIFYSLDDHHVKGILADALEHREHHALGSNDRSPRRG